METRIDKVVSWSQMIFAIATINERKVLQVRIIVERQIIEDYHSEELQDFNGCCLDILSDNISALLIAEITILVVATPIRTCQTCK